MADHTAIEWTDATWNPVTGCTKVSTGCKHCYAEREWARLSANPKTPRYFGRQFTDVQCHMDVLTTPLRWKKPRRIFVNSMSDLFHDGVPDLFIADVFAVMAAAPQHTFQVLTKRAARMQFRLGGAGILNFRMAVEEALAIYTDAPLVWPLPNVWLGVSVEDQATADARIPLLLDTPAAVRWISAEPLLGAVDLGKWVYDREVAIRQAMNSPAAYNREQAEDGIKRPLDWVVAGGESGPKARPSHPEWFRTLRNQCAVADVPFLFKQWGEHLPSAYLPKDTALPAKSWSFISINGGPAETYLPRPLRDEFAHHELMGRVGKKVAGRLLDGVLHDAYPEVQP
jgi:protein gp37